MSRKRKIWLPKNVLRAIKENEKKQPKLCVVCKKEFLPKTRRSKCCSKECSHERQIKYFRKKNDKYSSRPFNGDYILEEISRKELVKLLKSGAIEQEDAMRLGKGRFMVWKPKKN